MGAFLLYSFNENIREIRFYTFSCKGLVYAIPHTTHMLFSVRSFIHFASHTQRTFFYNVASHEFLMNDD